MTLQTESRTGKQSSQLAYSRPMDEPTDAPMLGCRAPSLTVKSKQPIGAVSYRKRSMISKPKQLEHTVTNIYGMNHDSEVIETQRQAPYPLHPVPRESVRFRVVLWASVVQI